MKEKIWEVTLTNGVYYFKGTKEYATNKVFPQNPIMVRSITQKEFLKLINKQGVQLILR